MWFWIAVGLVSLPMLIPYLIDMWQLEHYQYAPFAILTSGWLFWQRHDRQWRGLRDWMGSSLFLLGCLTAFTSLQAGAAWFGIVAFVAFAFAFARSQSGPRDFSLTACAIPLLLLIRLPVGLDQLLIIKLQRITSSLASVLLDLIRVPHSMQGNILTLVDSELFVAEACSGIQSVFTLAFLSMVLVAWNRRRLWLMPLYLLVSLILALLGNVIRIAVIASAIHYADADLTSGLTHDLVGYFALAICIGFLLSFDQLFVTVLHPISDLVSRGKGNPFIYLWNQLFSDTLGHTGEIYGAVIARPTRTAKEWISLSVVKSNRIAQAVCGCLVLVVLGWASVTASRVDVQVPMSQLLKSQMIFDPGPGLFNGKIGEVVFQGHTNSRNGSNPRLGQNSDIWACDLEGLKGQFVISQTYSGWHELCVCYENVNWSLLDRDVVAAGELQGDGEVLGSEADNGLLGDSFVAAKFRSGTNEYGYLMFGAINEDGSLRPAPSTFGAFGSRFLGRLDRFGVVDQQNLLMTQFWFVSESKIEPRDLLLLKRAFVATRQRVAQAIMGNGDIAGNKTELGAAQ